MAHRHYLTGSIISYTKFKINLCVKLLIKGGNNVSEESISQLINLISVSP